MFKFISSKVSNYMKNEVVILKKDELNLDEWDIMDNELVHVKNLKVCNEYADICVDCEDINVDYDRDYDFMI